MSEHHPAGTDRLRRDPGDGARLYVYYRVPAAELATAVAAARALQAALAADWPGLRCSLLRRPELRDGAVTVMETYAGVSTPAFEAALQRAAAAAPALPAARQVERFVPLDGDGAA